MIVFVKRKFCCSLVNCKNYSLVNSKTKKKIEKKLDPLIKHNHFSL